MSKVSFRARALDATKLMPVYKACEIPDMKDFAQINRSVPQMPTGMEKEEESEHHLQRALSAQQVYGSSEALVIPIPEVQDINDRYVTLYPATYKASKQYIHIQAFGMDQEIPDYDMDSDDDSWLNEQTKKMEITPLKFEEMMDRLEKGSGQQVVTLQEAKLLLKEDDDLIIAVYDYWLNKRLKMQRPLIATVKSEKRDGTTTNNPYVAFRRRTEKMQTRKNRKNDEVSYEKMLKLRRDLQKTLTLLELLKRREKSKKELLQLTIEVLEKRNEMEDYSGAALAEAEEERDKHPTFVAPFALNSRGEWVQTFKGEEAAPVRKKRQYRKRKSAQPNTPSSTVVSPVQPFSQQQHSSGEVDVMDSSEDDMLSPALSQSDHEDENDPDGMFAFKRRKNVHYHQSLQSGLGNWSWYGPEQGGRGDKRFRFSLTSLPSGCVGFARRRIGRGGRVIFDRASTPWDDALERVDFGSSHHHSSIYSDYIVYVKDNKIPHYRPKTPPPEDEDPPPYSRRSGFDVETFQSHREQLMEMQREQQQKLLTQDSLGPSARCGLELTPPVSNGQFTLDSASAEFAVQALVDTPSQGKGVATTTTLVAKQVTPGTNGKTIAKLSAGHLEASKANKLPSIQSPILVTSTPPTSSTSISLLHKSASTPVLTQVSGSTSLLSNLPLSTSTATILLSHKPNGPLNTSHVKSPSSSSGLSTSPAANVLQLNFPASSSSTPQSSPAAQRSLTSKLTTPTSGPTLFKRAPAAASTTQNNFDVLRTNHEEPSVILFNKDTGIPMDVT